MNRRLFLFVATAILVFGAIAWFVRQSQVPGRTVTQAPAGVATNAAVPTATTRAPGAGTPAAARSVGPRSSPHNKARDSPPGFTTPGQRTKNGTFEPGS